MGLFRRSKKKREQDAPSEEPLLKSDRIAFEMIETDSDEHLNELAEDVMNGTPLIINFDPLTIDQANKVIAFLSGVCFAIDGVIVQVRDKIFMFASADVYEDGSMEDFLKDFVE
ncbi:MAG: cell division protein SepF [Acholeplasmataceae bacterium]